MPERFETIFNQTFQNWELIVCDSHSDDGSWEYIQELAAREPRMKISQTPRNGVYAGFNDCISLARGEYVYIATSDDTMALDFLEKMVMALEKNPDCGIAHCCLYFIDEHSNKIFSGHCWDNWYTTRFFGDWNKKYHVRSRGHDTIVALALKTVYYSITQILLRRRLFDAVGMFEGKWGSFGDLEWQMRATLATKTVHVPEYLATWRIHPQQASQIEHYFKAIRDGWFCEIAETVITFSRKHNLPMQGGLPGRLKRFYWMESIDARMAAEKTFYHKLIVVLKSLWSNPKMIKLFLKTRLRSRFLGRRPDIDGELRGELSRLNVNDLVAAK